MAPAILWLYLPLGKSPSLLPSTGAVQRAPDMTGKDMEAAILSQRTLVGSRNFPLPPAPAWIDWTARDQRDQRWARGHYAVPDSRVHSTPDTGNTVTQPGRFCGHSMSLHMFSQRSLRPFQTSSEPGTAAGSREHPLSPGMDGGLEREGLRDPGPGSPTQPMHPPAEVYPQDAQLSNNLGREPALTSQSLFPSPDGSPATLGPLRPALGR